MKMKNSNKKAFTILIAIFISTLTLFSQRDIIVDADTGNEVDDLYALARILMEPTVNVTALNAAHWQTSHWAVEKSMENSHRLNQQLLGEMGLSVKTNRGGAERMYDWGDRAQHSAAAYEIINQANRIKSDDKLTVLVLGALTNVASAIFIQPDIASKLKVYWLGSTMDYETEVLKRNDFNCAMDQFAMDYLLGSLCEMFIMPVSVASAMEIDYRTLKEKTYKHFLGEYLLNRWEQHIDGARKKRVLWDLALISAFIHPEMATVKKVKTSRDSGNREINFYNTIDAEAIYNDFFETLLSFESK